MQKNPVLLYEVTPIIDVKNLSNPFITGILVIVHFIST